MARSTSFLGCNLVLTPPRGWSEDQVQTMPAFKNQSSIVSCWELDLEETSCVLQEQKVWVEVLSHSFAPMFVGSEDTVRQVTADYGATWPRAERERGASMKALAELKDLRDKAAGNVVMVPAEILDRLLGEKQ